MVALPESIKVPKESSSRCRYHFLYQTVYYEDPSSHVSLKISRIHQLKLQDYAQVVTFPSCSVELSSDSRFLLQIAISDGLIFHISKFATN